MRCISPIKAGYDGLGNITYSIKSIGKELVGFELECRKCLPCRLNIAREKAVRCYHQSQMHDHNIFLTLTYDDEHLKSPWLQYSDFQLFMKSLRESVTRDITDKETLEKLKIPMMVTGEYGDKNKRPHWHALIFNYSPPDISYKRSTDRGDKVYDSDILRGLWKRGTIEIGSLTIDSAGYVARYAAKKLTHGRDEEHNYHPIHKTSSRHGIGRTWIEKYCDQTFTRGFVLLPDGSKTKIPRYYVDWAKQHKPELWLHYVTKVRPKIIEDALLSARREELDHFTTLANYKGGAAYPLTRAKVKETVLQSKFKKLQERLKL